jgi:hypothetical protein
MKKLLLFLTLFVCAIPAPAQNKARMLAGVNTQTGTSYTFAQTDAVYLVTFNNASAVAASLPAPSNTGFGAGSIFSVKNIGAGLVTISVTLGKTIDGSTSIMLSTGQGADIFSDGTNYTSQRGAGTAGGRGSPAPPTNSLQKNNGASGFSASSATDDGTDFNVENLRAKGPNPYYDLTQYGLYTGSGAAITCSITSGMNNLSCGGGISDFAVGQGIEIPLAGVTPTFPAWGVSSISSFSRTSNVATYTLSSIVNVPVPGAGQTVTIAGMSDGSFNGTFTVTGNDGNFGHFFTANSGSNVSTTASAGTATLTSAAVVVTPAGILNGSTTYAYKIVMRGYHGELSVASPAGTTTVGAATLGLNTVNVTSCSRTSGLATCTASATHNFHAGVAVDLEGTTQFSSINNQYNGTHVIVSTPTSTTFTFYQASQANDSGTDTGGTAKVVAKNVVQWDMVPYSVLQSIVYRSKNGGAYSIVGIVEGMDGAFVDWGLAAPIAPGYVPSTPPSSVTNGILATTITGISGTTLTLAANAGNTAASQTAQHDNAPIVLAGCAALPSLGGGTLYIPALNPVAVVPFNSPVDLLHGCSTAQVTLTLASTISANDPIIMKQFGSTVNSAPGAVLPGNQFQYYSSTSVNGNAYPFFYFSPGSFGPNTLTNLSMNCLQAYQSCVVQDQDQGGGGAASISYDNDTFTGNAGAMPFIMRSGGFNFWFTKSQFAVNAGAWGVPEALQITVPNPLGGTDARFGNGWSMAGIIAFDKTVWQGHGIEYNDWGTPNIVNNGAHATFFEPLIENPYTPWMNVYLTGAGSVFGQLKLINASYADFRSGQATPFISFSPFVRISGIISEDSSCSNSFQPLFEGNITQGVQITQGGSSGSCSLTGTSNAIINNLNGGFPGASATNYQNTNLEFTGTGKAYFAMTTPVAPASVTVSAGGSLTVGSNCYSIFAYDKDGGWTVNGPSSCATTTSGNQTVTITRPTLPGNATGWNATWFPPGGGSSFLNCTAIPLATTTLVQSAASGCGNPFNAYTTAGSANIGPTGVSGASVTTNQFTLIPTVFANLGRPIDGTFYFCNDCTVANPCAGGGTGALAKRLNGVWVCN